MSSLLFGILNVPQIQFAKTSALQYLAAPLPCSTSLTCKNSFFRSANSSAVIIVSMGEEALFSADKRVPPFFSVLIYSVISFFLLNSRFIKLSDYCFQIEAMGVNGYLYALMFVYIKYSTL